MPLVPIAAFLTGALLTILLPIALLIALVAWYWIVSVRVPDTSGSDVPPAPAASGPEPSPASGAGTAPHEG